jgi:two-component system phosphate regulon sensor histidine kinase PhoR
VRVERDIDLTTTTSFDPPLVQLAVLNLLENAKKYAPAGGPYRVTVRRVEQRVRIEVADHGPGVPRAWRARIFEPFERGDDRLSRATDGTGIGLALVRAVARAHGGDASLDDTSDGARFVLEIRDEPGAASAAAPDEVKA